MIIPSNLITLTLTTNSCISSYGRLYRSTLSNCQRRDWMKYCQMLTNCKEHGTGNVILHAEQMGLCWNQCLENISQKKTRRNTHEQKTLEFKKFNFLACTLFFDLSIHKLQRSRTNQYACDKCFGAHLNNTSQIAFTVPSCWISMAHIPLKVVAFHKRL